MESKIGIYLRVSTEDQKRTGLGLGDQEVQCRKYIDLYYSGTEPVIYKDDGFTGTNLERPAMKSLMSDVQKGTINVIVSYKLDRISRSVVDTYKLLSFVIEQNCVLISVVDRLDISSANGRMLVGMLSIINQWEVETIRDRTLASLEQIAREGRYPCGGKDPLGWYSDDKNKMHVDPRGAEIINYMADCYIEGFELKDIHQMIFEKYNVNIYWKSIKELLLREQNIGLYTYHDVLYDDIFPAIMDKEKYERVLKIAEFRTASNLKRYSYLFYGLVYCQCGNKVQHVHTLKTRKGVKIPYRYYYCLKCNKRIAESKLEKQVIYRLFKNDQNNVVEKKRNTTYSKINNLDKKKETTFEDYCNGIIDSKSYTYAIEKIESKKKELLELSETLEVNKYKEYKQLDTKQKYDFIHRIFADITVDLEKGVVVKIEEKKN